jgi:hypothetical protein
MRRLFKIVLILTALSGVALGLRHALAQRAGQQSAPRTSFAATINRPHEKITVRTGDGSFILKNLMLVKVQGSTVVKGSVVNKTKSEREQVSFKVTAYDRDGRVLKGLESETVFTAQALKANRAAPINHGYGVWLQGIAAEDIARIEISEVGAQRADIPIVARIVPLASHALEWEKYAEVEE